MWAVGGCFILSMRFAMPALGRWELSTLLAYVDLGAFCFDEEEEEEEERGGEAWVLQHENGAP